MNGAATEADAARKARAVRDFHDHVSSGKVRFWQRYGMDLVMGRREGCFFWDLVALPRPAAAGPLADHPAASPALRVHPPRAHPPLNGRRC